MIIKVFHKTGSSWFLTHGLVKTFLAHAVRWICKLILKLIQKDKFSYIRFDKFFLTQHIFDVALPITLQLNKSLFSRITLCANFHLPRLFIKSTYFPIFGLHLSSVSCVQFLCKWDKIPWTIFKIYIRFVLSEGQVN